MRILVVGGSDAGISAALRAREYDPDSTVTMLVADTYPNFSICGIPYHLSGEVPEWRDLAHRTAADLEATGIDVRIKKRYYPGATPTQIRLTGDRNSGRLLGAQLVGTHGAEIAKRVDTYAVALHTGLTVEQLLDLDLSYTPPLGSPWDAIQLAAQNWLSAR